jgi:hypothetical protein
VLIAKLILGLNRCENHRDQDEGIVWRSQLGTLVQLLSRFSTDTSLETETLKVIVICSAGVFSLGFL